MAGATSFAPTSSVANSAVSPTGASQGNAPSNPTSTSASTTYSSSDTNRAPSTAPPSGIQGSGGSGASGLGNVITSSSSPSSNLVFVPYGSGGGFTGTIGGNTVPNVTASSGGQSYSVQSTGGATNAFGASTPTPSITSSAPSISASAPSLSISQPSLSPSSEASPFTIGQAESAGYTLGYKATSGSAIVGNQLISPTGTFDNLYSLGNGEYAIEGQGGQGLYSLYGTPLPSSYYSEPQYQNLNPGNLPSPSAVAGATSISWVGGLSSAGTPLNPSLGYTYTTKLPGFSSSGTGYLNANQYNLATSSPYFANELAQSDLYSSIGQQYGYAYSEGAYKLGVTGGFGSSPTDITANIVNGKAFISNNPTPTSSAPTYQLSDVSTFGKSSNPNTPLALEPSSSVTSADFLPVTGSAGYYSSNGGAPKYYGANTLINEPGGTLTQYTQTPYQGAGYYGLTSSNGRSVQYINNPEYYQEFAGVTPLSLGGSASYIPTEGKAFLTGGLAIATNPELSYVYYSGGGGSPTNIATSLEPENFLNSISYKSEAQQQGINLSLNQAYSLESEGVTQNELRNSFLNASTGTQINTHPSATELAFLSSTTPKSALALYNAGAPTIFSNYNAPSGTVSTQVAQAPKQPTQSTPSILQGLDKEGSSILNTPIYTSGYAPGGTVSLNDYLGGIKSIISQYEPKVLTALQPEIQPIAQSYTESIKYGVPVQEYLAQQAQKGSLELSISAETSPLAALPEAGAGFFAELANPLNPSQANPKAGTTFAGQVGEAEPYLVVDAGIIGYAGKAAQASTILGTDILLGSQLVTGQKVTPTTIAQDFTLSGISSLLLAGKATADLTKSIGLDVIGTATPSQENVFGNILQTQVKVGGVFGLFSGIQGGVTTGATEVLSGKPLNLKDIGTASVIGGVEGFGQGFGAAGIIQPAFETAQSLPIIGGVLKSPLKGSFAFSALSAGTVLATGGTPVQAEATFAGTFAGSVGAYGITQGLIGERTQVERNILNNPSAKEIASEFRLTYSPQTGDIANRPIEGGNFYMVNSNNFYLTATDQNVLDYLSSIGAKAVPYQAGLNDIVSNGAGSDFVVSSGAGDERIYSVNPNTKLDLADIYDKVLVQSLTQGNPIEANAFRNAVNFQTQSPSGFTYAPTGVELEGNLAQPAGSRVYAVYETQNTVELNRGRIGALTDILTGNGTGQSIGQLISGNNPSTESFTRTITASSYNADLISNPEKLVAVTSGGADRTGVFFYSDVFNGEAVRSPTDLLLGKATASVQLGSGVIPALSSYNQLKAGGQLLDIRGGVSTSRPDVPNLEVFNTEPEAQTNILATKGAETSVLSNSTGQPLDVTTYQGRMVAPGIDTEANLAVITSNSDFLSVKDVAEGNVSPYSKASPFSSDYRPSSTSPPATPPPSPIEELPTAISAPPEEPATPALPKIEQSTSNSSAIGEIASGSNPTSTVTTPRETSTLQLDKVTSLAVPDISSIINNSTPQVGEIQGYNPTTSTTLSKGSTSASIIPPFTTVAPFNYTTRSQGGITQEIAVGGLTTSEIIPPLQIPGLEASSSAKVATEAKATTENSILSQVNQLSSEATSTSLASTEATNESVLSQAAQEALYQNTAIEVPSLNEVSYANELLSVKEEEDIQSIFEEEMETQLETQNTLGILTTPPPIIPGVIPPIGLGSDTDTLDLYGRKRSRLVKETGREYSPSLSAISFPQNEKAYERAYNPDLAAIVVRPLREPQRG